MNVMNDMINGLSTKFREGVRHWLSLMTASLVCIIDMSLNPKTEEIITLTLTMWHNKKQSTLWLFHKLHGSGPYRKMHVWVKLEILRKSLLFRGNSDQFLLNLIKVMHAKQWIRMYNRTFLLHEQFSSKYSQKTLDSSPVRLIYGVSFVNLICNLIIIATLCICGIVLYKTVLIRGSTVESSGLRYHRGWG